MTTDPRCSSLDQNNNPGQSILNALPHSHTHTRIPHVRKSSALSVFLALVDRLPLL